MSISIKVRDVLGCALADAVFDGMCLVAGQNHMGKTSMLRAVRATLLGIPDAGLGRKKSELSQFVHELSRVGRCTIADTGAETGGESTMEWPKGEFFQGSAAPGASLIASGAEQFSHLPVDRRREIITGILETLPTFDDFERSCKDEKITGEKTIAGIWKLVEDRGWDGAWKARATYGTEQKGAWQQRTGEQRWGSNKAENWIPGDWQQVGLAGDGRGNEVSESAYKDLEQTVVACQEQLERLLREAGTPLSENDRREAELKVGKLAQWKKEHNEAETKVLELQAIEEGYKVDLRAERNVQMPPKCPWCSKPLKLIHGEADADIKIQKGAVPGEVDHTLQASQDRMADARNKLAKLQPQLEAAVRLRTTLQEQMDGAEAAQKALDNATSTSNIEQDIAAARGGLDIAVKQRDFVRAALDARHIHRLIVANQKIIDILAPEGLRQRKIAEALAGFYETRLQPLCEAARWPSVTLRPDMTLAMGNREEWRLSGSERLAADVVLQAAIAEMDGSDLILVDEAQTLVGQDRVGLFKMLHEACDVPALIAMSAKDEAATPRIDKAKMGAVYWMVDGKLKPIE